MEFAQRLKQAMEDKSITAYRLAKELGVHQTTIRNWLDGKGEPHLAQLKRIAKILNADIIYLISGQTSAEVERGILIQAENEVRSELEKLQFKSKDRPYEERVSLSEALIRMFKLFGGFNSTGHKKAVERVEELTEIPRYRRAETTPQPPAEPQGGTDTTPAPEGAEGPPEGK